MRVHIDTDLAGDPDDVCALAMLLGWPDVDIVGITTVDDPGGRRVGYASHCLDLVGRGDIPVAGGAEVSLTTLRTSGGIPDDARFWPRPVAPRPSPAGAALELLDRSVAQGATIIAIGPFTNLALLETMRPGRLSQVPVVAMGGYVMAPDAGFPQWEPARDYNVQCDTRAAEIVVASATQLTLVTLASTVKTHLRDADLARLRASGPLGQLMASQGLAQGDDYDNRALGRAHAGLPDDLLNFHHDPLACAVAVGLPDSTVETVRVQPVLDDGVLRFDRGDHGHEIRLLTGFPAESFGETWMCAVEAAQTGSST